MPRTNTVNFLQIENGLRQAIELCRSEAGASYAVASAPRLEGLQQALAHCTKRADTAYLGWRECIRKRMLSAKHLWLRFEAMRDELVELGLEVVPAGAKNAWVVSDFLGDVERLAAHLDEQDAELVLDAADWAAELRRKAEELRARVREEELALEDYRRLAPLRRHAIYEALAAVDEFDRLRADARR